MPFERLGRGQPAIEGTGLGLRALARLVEAMGGTLERAPALPGEGSTFWVELPRGRGPVGRPTAQQRAGRPAARGVTARTCRVLYIEDNLSPTCGWSSEILRRRPERPA